MTSQADQLKTWIKEILDGAMQSGFDNGLLHNYLNDAGWFGEISGPRSSPLLRTGWLSSIP